MRKIKLSLKTGGDAGEMIENSDGTVTGQGRAQHILELAPGKTLDYWINQLPHSHYLDFTVEQS